MTFSFGGLADQSKLFNRLGETSSPFWKLEILLSFQFIPKTPFVKKKCRICQRKSKMSAFLQIKNAG